MIWKKCINMIAHYAYLAQAGRPVLRGEALRQHLYLRIFDGNMQYIPTNSSNYRKMVHKYSSNGETRILVGKK